jgi:non-specific serine/threonine protein kinase
MLRIAASAANEAVDVVTQLPSTACGCGPGAVAQRYARPCRVTGKDISEALQGARQLRDGPGCRCRAPRRREDVAQGEPGTTEFSALLASRNR